MNSARSTPSIVAIHGLKTNEFNQFEEYLRSIDSYTQYISMQQLHDSFVAILLYETVMQAIHAITRIRSVAYQSNHLFCYLYLHNISQYNVCKQIYAKGNMFSLSDTEIYAMFEKYGDIISLDRTDPNVATIQYRDFHSAINAYQQIKSSKEKELQLYLYHQQIPKTDYQKEGKDIYMSNLPIGKYTEESITSIINQTGKPTNILVAKEEDNHYEGYAYASFQTHDEAQKAIEQLSNIQVCSTQIKAQYYIPKQEREAASTSTTQLCKEETTVFVKGLTGNIIEAQFKTEFEKYGKVNNIKIIGKEIEVDGIKCIQAKGIAFIEMATKEQAIQAIQSLSMQTINGSKLQCMGAKKSSHETKACKKGEYQTKIYNNLLQCVMPSIVKYYRIFDSIFKVGSITEEILQAASTMNDDKLNAAILFYVCYQKYNDYYISINITDTMLCANQNVMKESAQTIAYAIEITHDEINKVISL